MPLKRIPVDSAAVGMYIAGFDRSWFKTPFLRHRFLIRSQAQLEKLRRAGIREVLIDPSRGSDIEEPDKKSAQNGHLSHTLAAPLPEESPSKWSAPSVRDLNSARQAYERLADSIRQVFHSIGSSGTVRIEEAKEVVQEIIIVTRTLNAPALMLAIGRSRQLDRSLSEHALAVCTYTLILGQALRYGFSAYMIWRPGLCSMTSDCFNYRNT